MAERWASEHWTRPEALVGRARELQVLGDLLADLRAGRSGALVVHGEPGAGKTALLDALAELAVDARVVRVAGVEAEMELAFAAMHQLCAPMLDRLELLPKPQRQALEVTFGLSVGPAPERLLLGLAVLGLLSEVATDRPLICLVDDAQWLDEESAQVLAFVARRLGAEAVGLAIASREVGPELAGLPDLAVEGLGEEDARTLLRSVLTVPADPRVVDQFLAEAQGNPLAVLELTRGSGAAAFVEGFAPPHPNELAKTMEERFRQRVDRLPEETQRLLVLASADPLGDPLLLWRAAARLGIGTHAATPAVEDDLIAFGARVRFRHPLVRSAVYRSAAEDQRRAAHAALAEATDAAVDAERRAWHRAEAASGPDEDVASELEAYADRAQTRGGMAAAATFLERAAELTPDPADRAARALAAGEAKVHAGALTAASNLLAIAETGPLDESARARLDLVRAQLAFASGRSSQAPALLLQAARRLQAIDAHLARATYLDAFMAAHLAVSLAGPEADVAAVARAAASAPPPSHAPTPADLLLDGLATTYNDGYAAGLPLVLKAVATDTADMPAHQELRWLSVASRAAMHIWDDDRALAHSTRFVRLARETGALSELTFAVNDHALLLLISGEPSGSASAVKEAYATAEALGNIMVPWGPMGAAAWRGEDAEARALIDAYRHNAIRRGEGSALAGGAWAEAVLHNGFGRYADALAAARRAIDWINQGVFGLACWVLPELVEAAARVGKIDTVLGDLRQLDEMAEASGTDWASAVQARARALGAEDEDAEKFYRESIDRYGATRLTVELARAHLLYGEWLRRQRRRSDARDELRTALEVFEGMGMESFADRARRELRATGETARKRTVEDRTELTPQEAQVAQLAREGLSNPEIAARLFISARTVQYHLSKVFSKLGINSRSQLEHVLV